MTDDEMPKATVRLIDQELKPRWMRTWKKELDTNASETPLPRVLQHAIKETFDGGYRCGWADGFICGAAIGAVLALALSMLVWSQ